ncbi:MAG TPA: hypothetical protein VGH61_07545 [Steroidobacteraceae bacterium]
MPSTGLSEEFGIILRQFYDAVQRRDMKAARALLADDMVFVGFSRPPQYRRLHRNPHAVHADRVDATTLVAEWHQVRNGSIVRAQSAFDRRPFASMFARAKEHSHG